MWCLCLCSVHICMASALLSFKDIWLLQGIALLGQRQIVQSVAMSASSPMIRKHKLTPDLNPQNAMHSPGYHIHPQPNAAPRFVFSSLSSHSSLSSQPSSLLLPTPLTPIITPINLLLQHNTIHTSLQQRTHQTSLPLQQPQSIQYFCSRAVGESRDGG